MKRCAKCDAEYDDAYDGCPECAKPKVAPKANGGLLIIGVGLLGLGTMFGSSAMWEFLLGLALTVFALIAAVGWLGSRKAR